MSDEKHQPEHIPTRLLTDIRLCFAFFTRLPVKWPEGVPFSRLGPAMWAFPLVGWAVGALSLVVGFLVIALLNDLSVAVLCALAASLLFTGAMHEDGLADIADGFGGGKDRKSKLEIMKDSRIGTYGVLALIIVVSAKLQGLSSGLNSYYLFNTQTQFSGMFLTTEKVPLAYTGIGIVLGAAAISRAMAIAGMVYLSPARDDGMGADAGSVTTRTLLAALCVAIIPIIFLVNPFLVLAAVVAAGTAIGLLFYFSHRQIGGYTGDVIGAAQLIGEVVFLLVAGRLLFLASP